MKKEDIERMRLLYSEMDGAYDALAGKYGFSCDGCEDNCCTQRFYHHAVAEYFYLLEGIKKADPELREQIFRKSMVVTESYWHEVQAGEVFKLMCPANFDGLCSVYEWRPMICRLHGLPHHFTMPDGTVRKSGGCPRTNDDSNGLLDRTPFYKELAEIEKSMREDMNYRQRFKKTTAQMFVDMQMELEMEEG